MPVRDGELFVDLAIQSIRAQSHRDIEVIIVDDGSRDGTPEILNRHAADDSRIRIIAIPPRGIVAALNHGIEAASGAMIARMDADDIAKPERLARQLEMLSRHPEAALVGSGYEVIDAAGRIRRSVSVPAAAAEIREALKHRNCIAHPTVLMRRDAVLAVGGYRRAFQQCEDYDLWLRLSERYDLLNIDEPLLLYREHSGQLTWSRLEQRILSELAAGESARCRSLGRSDPAEDIGPVTRRDLTAFGLGDAEIGAQIARRAFDAAREARRAGNRRAAWGALGLAGRQEGLASLISLRFWVGCARLLG
jgi:glycosyltransferase involved in cell wall biosynthesis